MLQSTIPKWHILQTKSLKAEYAYVLQLAVVQAVCGQVATYVACQLVDLVWCAAVAPVGPALGAPKGGTHRLELGCQVVTGGH